MIGKFARKVKTLRRKFEEVLEISKITFEKKIFYILRKYKKNLKKF